MRAFLLVVITGAALVGALGPVAGPVRGADPAASGSIAPATAQAQATPAPSAPASGDDPSSASTLRIPWPVGLLLLAVVMSLGLAYNKLRAEKK